jgi:pyrimidine-nucleoside phosphorylase
MDTAGIGQVAVLLGAGRERKDDTIDHAAGILLLAKTGGRVQAGRPIAALLCGNGEKAARAQEAFLAAITIADETPGPAPLVHARVDRDGVHMP